MVPLLIGFLVASPAYAGMTGSTLYAACNTRTEHGETTCSLWMSGFGSGMYSAQRLAHRNHLPAVTCFPDEISGTEVRAVVEKFMRDNPALLHFDADVLATTALGDAFPCPKSN
jgi:Rap1a immunity proteins